MSAVNLFKRTSPSALARILQESLSPTLKLSFRLLPRLAKLAAYLLVILNLHSLPFGWHIKLFWPVFRLRWMAWCVRMGTLSLSSATRNAAASKYLDNLSPSGQNPLDRVALLKGWAGPDDCDYNWHLSNSSYPKVLDYTRMNSALNNFPYYLRAGGWVALAGTHFHFIREIPMFARYEVRSQIIGWNSKWFYIVHRFVTHRKPTSRSTKFNNDETPSATPPRVSNSNASATKADHDHLLPTAAAPIPAIHTPSTPLTDLSPSPSSTNLQIVLHPPSNTTTAVPTSTRVPMVIEPELDGATLHCISVNVMVFKHGRITVPPALVLAGEGFGATPEQGIAARERALALGLDGMRQLYRGGWRAVVSSEQGGTGGANGVQKQQGVWWDEAMRGLEGRVERRMQKVVGVREGLDGALEIKGL